MHTRRLITFLLGAWYALTLCVAAFAPISATVADRVSKAPPGEASRALMVVGETMSNQLFLYVASEINRTGLEYFGLVELGILFTMSSFLLLQNYSKTATILAGVMLLTALASHFLVVPQVVAQGRLLDFRAAETMLPERANFSEIHHLFTGVTVLRLLCGAWIGGLLLFRGPNSRIHRQRGQRDAVDHAQDSHVDR